MFAAFVVENDQLAEFLTNPQSLAYWLQYGGRGWLVLIGTAFVVALVIAFLYSTLVHRNPVTGLERTLRGLGEGAIDVLCLPLGMRRVWAIARLAFIEALRRKVLYVFVLFLVPFLFAGWYLPNTEEGQLVALVAFVTNAMTWLLLPLVVFLTSMSLPNDLKTQTIHTVVTKPVRRLEIVVGRTLGFMGIYTLVLLVMGSICLAYLASQIYENKTVWENQWKARVPVYAAATTDLPVINERIYPLLFFKDGQFGPGATNVGKEWAYRSHVEGATSDSAHWFFTFDPKQFEGAKTVRVEMTFDIFKTTKGDPTRADKESSGVWCLLTFLDRQTNEKLYDATFRVNHHRITALEVPASVLKSGVLVVVAQCLTRNQFLGMATHDLYFLANEKSFAGNFLKGLISLWLKIFLLTAVAVASSTVLNGFVTVLFATMIYVVGFYHGFLLEIVTGQLKGGGPLESAIRLVTQDNQITPLDENLFTTIVKNFDGVMIQMMKVLAYVVPNLSTLDTTQFVAEGFDIPWALVVRNVLAVFGYVVPVLVLGYYFLKTREIAT